MGVLPVDVLERLVAFLLDGGWHTHEELEGTTGLSKLRLLMVLRFLSDFQMLELDEVSGRCRLEPSTFRSWVGLVNRVSF